MADEHESAVAAWLDSPETKRELDIMRERFPNWTEFQRVQIALSMEILTALDVYGSETITLAEIPPPPPPDDDPPEPWKDPDATGWSP